VFSFKVSLENDVVSLKEQHYIILKNCNYSPCQQSLNIEINKFK